MKQTKSAHQKKTPSTSSRISRNSARPPRSNRHKELRIAHLHWGFPPIIGGVETHLAMMLPTFVQMGHRAFLLTGNIEGSPLQYDFHGAHIWRTPLMDLNWLFKRGLSGLSEEVQQLFCSFIEKSKPDILHAHNMHYFSKPHAAMLSELARKKGIPLILTAHNVWDDQVFLDLTRNIGWNFIIAVSHYIKRELVGIGVPESQCDVIHHGIDHGTFHPQASTEKTLKKYPQLKGRRLIFHPARMGLAKGCDTSLKAFNIIHRRFPDTMLVLAGTKNIIDWGGTQQKDIAYFIRLVNFFNIRDHVLIDAFSIDQMPGLYASSEIVFYPSTAMEPFGLTMLEAMATAKPLIVTAAGGMPEIVQDNINGFVIPIKDFESLAGRTCRLLAEESLRARFGHTGRQMVERHYTKEVMTENHLEVYRQLLG